MGSGHREQLILGEGDEMQRTTKKRKNEKKKGNRIQNLFKRRDFFRLTEVFYIFPSRKPLETIPDSEE